jgi:branched-chain amino acid transport system permease protein
VFGVGEKGRQIVLEDLTEVHDRDEFCRLRFEKKQRDFLRKLVSPEVIEEHRRTPLGQHSEGLERLLIYFNRRPLAGKYAIVTIKPFKAYRIVALSGERAVPPKVIDDKIYVSHAEAQHALFLRNLDNLLES